jgi:quercetin dioxygenase-like cupin family protein
MKVTHFEEVTSQPVEMPGSSGCRVRWLVSRQDGAPTFAMRQFEVAPGGYTPKHSHPYEHEVFVLEGHGMVLEGNREHRLKAGDVVLVVPDEVHQFRNTGDGPLKFLCLVPHIPEGTPVTLAPECEGI